MTEEELKEHRQFFDARSSLETAKRGLALIAEVRRLQGELRRITGPKMIIEEVAFAQHRAQARAEAFEEAAMRVEENIFTEGMGWPQYQKALAAAIRALATGTKKEGE